MYCLSQSPFAKCYLNSSSFLPPLLKHILLLFHIPLLRPLLLTLYPLPQFNLKVLHHVIQSLIQQLY